MAGYKNEILLSFNRKTIHNPGKRCKKSKFQSGGNNYQHANGTMRPHISTLNIFFYCKTLTK